MAKKMTNIEKHNDFDMSDRPINDVGQDCFKANERIVNKIYNFVRDASLSQLTVAITGEWGIGKTSVINLLRKKFEEDEKNVVVSFEPLLDGKFEITDIMESFYLKLYQNISDTDTNLKEVIKKSLKSLLILSRCKISIGAKVPALITGLPVGHAEGKVECDLGKNIDDVLKLWEKEKPQSFTRQSEEINTLLKKTGYRLYVIIDEVDRLSVRHIINFLLFCRILESFDNIVCVVGIDYKHVISKLTNENNEERFSYEIAVAYLDKLFQLKYQVHHNVLEMIPFAEMGLHQIDSQLIPNRENKKDNYESQIRFREIVTYLSTPRQIKKWLIAVKSNYSIIRNFENYTDILSMLAFIAVIIRHPIVTDHCSKHTIKLLTEQQPLSRFILNEYGINFSRERNKDAFMIASLGISITGNAGKIDNSQGDVDNLNSFLCRITENPIFDVKAERYAKDFLNLPVSFILLLIEGFSNDSEVSLYANFFGGAIDSAIEALVQDNGDILAYDLAESLSKRQIMPSKAPSLKTLETLWHVKTDDFNFNNPYFVIIGYILGKIPVEQAISDLPLALSERYIHKILYEFSVSNKDGIYELKNINRISPDNAHIEMKPVVFEGKNILDFDKSDIEKIINSWLEEVSRRFTNSSLIKDVPLKGILNVFYRYIQWGKAIGQENRQNLVNFVKAYLYNNDISSLNKNELIKNIIQECNVPETLGSKDSYPLKTLFNEDIELIKLIREMGNKIIPNLKMSGFQKMISHLLLDG